MPSSSAPAAIPTGKATTLWNRTFIGLLLAQFLAAFNDQAIHSAGMFYSINTRTLTEATAISLMPILFFAPWAIFCTLAGYFSDKYSKRFSLIFWKVAEVGIALLALAGFVLGSQMNMPTLGSWIVLSTVFLMGTHSTFFVPAKYGCMPEILPDYLLSRGNGILESLSFLATILGTVSGGVLAHYFRGNEYVIGIILTTLAVIGAAGSFLIRPMPAAKPDARFPRWIYGPLVEDVKRLWVSRPLRFVLFGIAFFTFMLAFMRAAVYMLGETRVPRWTELQTSAVVGMTAFGIGLGSPLAGWLSGKKVELGLVPIGAAGMILMTCLAAVFLNNIILLTACIVVVGFFTGFYLVPLFTLQQHRAPKDAKGKVVATMNFTNVTGAILASVLFFVVVRLVHQTGITPRADTNDVAGPGRLLELQEDLHHRPVFVKLETAAGGKEFGKPVKEGEVGGLLEIPDDEANGDRTQVVVSQKTVVAWHEVEVGRRENRIVDPPRIVVSGYKIGVYPHYYVRLETESAPTIYDNRELPRYLFLGAGVMTLGVLFLLTVLLPDLIRRSIWLVRSIGKERLAVENVHALPNHGPVILVVEISSVADSTQVMWASDRTVAAFLKSVPAVSDLNSILAADGVAAMRIDHWNDLAMKLRSEWTIQKPSVAVVPVRCTAALVRFFPPTTLDSTTESLRAAMHLSG